jgi:Adenylate and Guanylate cyclase catalytic domain
MESNGERNRIHVSQVTADLIKQAGKRHWLTTRRDKIVAKGKGEMQTYWCDPLAIKGRFVEKSNATDERESETRMAAPAASAAKRAPEGQTKKNGMLFL